ncbi:hypothetical protein [Pantoea ananatis]|uniref:hypothetical protein n=1 Tax=Pantoea ananas TaxID=553 RepID=UPI0021E946E5|nr:hypothetical protein [Pantoea ananatis]MCW1777368.1 hypothetical protein [Pantoea ananatis]UYK95579.1 hypothetical protein NG826_23890 [Pantoea ananatis]
MTTESAFSNDRWPLVSKPRIQGYRHIYRLSCMEGALMAISALQRLTGEKNQAQIAFIAVDFVRERYCERSELSASCSELAEVVETLARRIDADWWSHWINYEKTALKREHT